jgi:protein MpaA
VKAAFALVAVCCVLTVASSADAAGHTLLIGRSSQGRAITATLVGDPAARVRILVVGCIHGDEPAGIAVARRLLHVRPPRGVALWIVPVLNPDGLAAATRQNGRGVDLNRNFPWRWRDLEGTFDSGARPLSEPESRAAAALIRRVRPTVSVWYHQHLGVVDESGGSVSVERKYARKTGLPLRRLTRYPGSVASWENRILRGSTAFVVELPAGSLSRRAVDRHARAVLSL